MRLRLAALAFPPPAPGGKRIAFALHQVPFTGLAPRLASSVAELLFVPPPREVGSAGQRLPGLLHGDGD